MPIISKVNNEEIGLINVQRFKIIKLGVFTITIENDQGNLKLPPLLHPSIAGLVFEERV